jgi:hypothetical protein
VQPDGLWRMDGAPHDGCVLMISQGGNRAGGLSAT